MMSGFDYKGFTKEYLENICSEASCIREKSELRNYGWGMYGLGRIIRQYAYYPQSWPLLCCSNHGVSRKLIASELDATMPFNLYFSHSLAEKHKKESTKPSYSMLSPFIWYRHRHRIEKLPTAKGTLVYFPHSTELIDNIFNIDDYINKLKNLPKDMYPLCISLHMWDIRKGLHEILLDEGFAVVSSGHSEDIRFHERFYDILKNFKYTTSNSIGSNVFYSVEMGTPFFLLGEKNKYFNYGDSNCEKGNYTSFTKRAFYIKEMQIFNEMHSEITLEQKDYVEGCLGIKDEERGLNISRFRLSFLLYKHIIIYYFFTLSKRIKHMIISFIKKYFPVAVEPLKKFRNKLSLIKNKLLSSYKYIKKSYYFAYEYIHYPKARKIFTHLTIEEKHKLYTLAKNVAKQGGNNFLEIGSYLGASSVIIASAMGKNSSKRLYCIDTWNNETMPDGLQDTFALFKKNTNAFLNVIYPYRGTSASQAQMVNEKFDFIFFDADHSYKGIKTDWDEWSPKLNDGAVVAFHDIGWAEGVQRVVNEDVLHKTYGHGYLPNLFWGTIE